MDQMESSQMCFDRWPVFGGTPDDLSKTLLEGYLRRVRGIGLADLPIPWADLLLNLNALVQQNGVRLDMLPFGVLGVRNPTVAYFLRALRYGEGYGTGIATMIRRCEDANIRAPLFQQVGDDFCVTVYSRDYDRFHSS